MDKENLCLPGEIWKDIKDYEGLYQISNLGRVKSLVRKGRLNEQIFKTSINGGYPAAHLSKNNKPKWHKIHRLIAIHFIPNPKNLPFIHHLDENRLNYNINNLIWVTAKENTRFFHKAGRFTVHSDKSKIKKKEHKIIIIPEYYTNINIKLKNETWATIPDYDGYYEISNYGRIKSLLRQIPNGIRQYTVEEKLLQPRFMQSRGEKTYLCITLSKLSKKTTHLLHRLVAMSFIKNDNELPHVNHINCNKICNHVSNLEWITPQDNIKHAIKSGLMTSYGENCHLSRLTEKQVLEIRELHKNGMSINKLCELYNNKAIGKIVRRTSWKHI